MRTIGQLAVRVVTLRPGDSLGKAAEAVRCSSVGVVPVIDQGRLLGLVTSRLLADFLAQGSPERLKDLTVAALPLESVIALPDTLPPTEALRFFQANSLECAPVLDASGGLLGIVSNGELASAICGRVRPPLIGGMATPFGVYLTGGGARGGVGDFALMTTGIYLCVLNLAAIWLGDLLGGANGLLHSLPLVAQWLRSAPVNLSGWISDWLWVPLFALFFRLSWVSGFHAAEHQVVHTIEAGDDLRPEIVGEKPRVHPRCGTNIATAVLIMSGFWNWRLVGAEDALIAMLVTFFLWRRVGGWIQQFITTRPASLAQLENGITAGKQLIERYQDGADGPRSIFGRIWQMGLFQVFAGWLLVFTLLWGLQFVLPLPETLRITF
jgi:CBS domain-containing protein